MQTPDAWAALVATGGPDEPRANAVFASLYAELHSIARRHLSGRTHLTLGATTLLHEAYLVLANREPGLFPDRARFMTYAARVMRGLIVDYARNRQTRKRGGGFELTSEQ